MLDIVPCFTGSGHDHVKPTLEEKLHAVPAEQEGIVEDCSPSFNVPADGDGDDQPAVSPPETVVRDTDATTLTHEVEEINAEINHQDAASEWVDMVGSGALMKKVCAFFLLHFHFYIYL